MSGYPEENLSGILGTRSLVAIFLWMLSSGCPRQQLQVQPVFPRDTSYVAEHFSELKWRFACHACKAPSYFSMPWNHWKKLSPALSSGETKEQRRGLKRLSACSHVVVVVVALVGGLGLVVLRAAFWPACSVCQCVVLRPRVQMGAP